MKKWKGILTALLVCPMIFSGCGKEAKTETVTKEQGTENEKEQLGEEVQGVEKIKSDEVVTIRMGHHYVQEVDPRYKDPITGETFLSKDKIDAGEAALQAVLDELNVDFQFVQYAGNTTEVLLQSVMAGDPVCDIAWMWNGSQSAILGQNVLQPLNDYEHLFEGDDSWMLWDEVLDNRYFLNANLSFIPKWPLVYNISYIEKVDGLKENGKTVYPTDLFNNGEWTWSKFEEYLGKIDAYYSNSQSPNRPEKRVYAYETDYRQAALHAIYSNGSSIYGTEGLQVDSQGTKEAVNYIDNLMKKNLMTCERWNETDSSPGWTWNCNNFGNGETVFTNMADWMIAGGAENCATRGEAIGIIPFPRPDGMAADDPDYKQPSTAADCAGVLKGISPEKTELALEAFKLYYRTYYTELSGGTKATDYLSNNAEDMAMKYGFDVFHSEVGVDVLETFKYVGENMKTNDFSELTGTFSKWAVIMGDSIYGLNGSAKYDTAIENKKNVMEDSINDMIAITKSSEIRDNIAPKFTVIQSMAFPAGIDPEAIKWEEYLISEDNIDGPLASDTVIVKYNEEDFRTVGKYDQGLVATVKDMAGNEGKAEMAIIIYDSNSTELPAITIKEEYRKVKLEEDASAIAWKDDFVESAVDKDGLDIKQNIKADLSQLDTTTKGKYPVEISVTDYVGNQTVVIIEVEVE